MMTIKTSAEKNTHPIGEPIIRDVERIALDTFGGRLHVEWDQNAEVSSMGLLPYFADFLKTADLFEPWVRSCPLKYKSGNAPAIRDVLGTLVLSLLSGQRRYAHITSLRNEGVAPSALGMKKICSEDSVRRAFDGADEATVTQWMRAHLRRGWEHLLDEPWILDIDTTVKTLYGRKQEGGVVGYNPRKPGRPSHSYHTYFMGGTRIVLDVEVEAGNHTASAYTAPGLFAFIDRLSRKQRPRMLRGDCGFGNERIIAESEQRELEYLFKLRSTTKVHWLVEDLFQKQGWEDAGQGWEGMEARLKLQGWSRERRVIVLRRRIRELVTAQPETTGQLLLLKPGELTRNLYEHAVLVTNLDMPLEALAQLYRERADCENIYDELKNQWGWGGFTTKDLSRCRTMARVVALVYNWWTIFSGLAIIDRHAEALTSRPLLLYAVGRITNHGGQTMLTVTSSHGKAAQIRAALTRTAAFFRRLRETTAEQLNSEARWRLILSRAFMRFLGGRTIGTAPPALAFQV